jgi:putative oxidoreductase
MSLAFFHKRSMLLLRWALGIVFGWFGLLQIFNASPAQELLIKSIPGLGGSQLLLFLVAFIEFLIGVALLSNRYIKIAVIVMILLLLIESVAVLITQGFDPRFPLLSLAGEFTLKNLVLMGGGLVLIAEKEEQPENNPQDNKKRPNK